ncbi:uncharacterized protein ACBR49_011269 isoform 2-T2 [Aulostomus maculatus]
MASEEDDALLFLIFQHLKVNGYRRAAKVLEKHVTQVETPKESSNLHDIYTGWMKLCSLAQHAKQEAEDATSFKKQGIKPEPATSEEDDDAVRKLACNSEDHVDAKPPLEPMTDVGESPHADVSEQLLDPATKTKNLDNKSCDSSGSAAEKEEEEEEGVEEEEEGEGEEDEEGGEEEEEEEGEGTKSQQESAPAEVSVEGLNGAESSSSDSEEVAEPAVSTRGQAASDQISDQPEAPDPAGISLTEPKQESEAATEASDITDEKSASEEAAVNQTEAASPTKVSGDCAEHKEVQCGVWLGAVVVSKTRQAEPAAASPTAQETNDQPAEGEAPPPAGSKTRCPDPECDLTSEEGEAEKEEKSKMDAGELTAPPEPDERDATDDGKAAAAAAGERADSDVSIILNIADEDCEAAERETSSLLPGEAAESFKTPKRKKKKSRKAADSPTTDASLRDAPAETPLASKRKRKDKPRQEEPVEEVQTKEEEEEEEDASPTTSSKKRKAKKRKKERDEVEEKDEGTPAPAPERKIKKRKNMRDVEEEEVVGGAMEEEQKVEDHVSPAGEKKKKKKKKRTEGEVKEEVQGDEAPAGGDGGTKTKLETTDGNSSQVPSTKKKHRLRRKLSLRKRLRLHMRDLSGRKKLKQSHDETPRRKPPKSPQPEQDATLEDHIPKKKKKMKMNTEQEENSSKENQPPPTKKGKKKKTTTWTGEETDGGVASQQDTKLPAEASSLLPEEGKKKKQKKTRPVKGAGTTGSLAAASRDAPARKKKRKLKATPGAPESDPEAAAPNAASTKKKSSKKKMVPC